MLQWTTQQAEKGGRAFVGRAALLRLLLHARCSYEASSRFDGRRATCNAERNDHHCKQERTQRHHERHQDLTNIVFLRRMMKIKQFEEGSRSHDADNTDKRQVLSMFKHENPLECQSRKKNLSKRVLGRLMMAATRRSKRQQLQRSRFQDNSNKSC